MKTIAIIKQAMLFIWGVEHHFRVHLHKKDFFRCRKYFERLVRMDLLVNTSSQLEENLQLGGAYFTDYYILINNTYRQLIYKPIC